MGFIRIVHQSRTLKEKCQPSPFRYDSEQWLMVLSDKKTWSRRERESAFFFTGLLENIQCHIKIRINAYSMAGEAFHRSTGLCLVHYELPHSSATHYKFPLIKKRSQRWHYACFYPIRWLASLSAPVTPSHSLGINEFYSNDPQSCQHDLPTIDCMAQHSP